MPWEPETLRAGAFLFIPHSADQIMIKQPGHANIKGNEYADMLAKEAAQEAKEKENLPPVTSLGDVKEAARKSEFVKWQEMWEKSVKGRHLFQFRPKFNFEIAHTFQSSFGERIIFQVRKGYVELNDN